MVHRDRFSQSEEDRALQLLVSELGATPVDASESDERISTPRPIDPQLETIDPYYEELAEEEGASMVTRGIAKATTNGKHLTLLKGKPGPNQYDGPMEIDL